MARLRLEPVLVATLLLTALILRCGALLIFSSHLQEDRDAYLTIAGQLAQGRGYCDPITQRATAFRPPVYTIILVPITRLAHPEMGIALLHAVLGTATVFLTLTLGRRLGFKWCAYLAALLVAVDPLLLQYTTFPMTETIFTFLVTLLLAVVIEKENTRDRSDLCDAPGIDRGLIRPFRPTKPILFCLRREFGIGVIFGLCALCRPTIWAFGLMTAFWWCCRVARENKPDRINLSATPGADRRLAGPVRQVSYVQFFLAKIPWSMLLATTLTVSPWLVRNFVVMGTPILTTTHGGYTLLLGNNPVFYREVVRKPWGTVWDDASPDATHQTWYQAVAKQMEQELPITASEIDRDRWTYRRAWQNIKNEPSLFIRACCLRFRRFWHVAPLGRSAKSVPVMAQHAVRLFYVFVTIGFLLGIVRLKWAESSRWLPLALLLTSFTLVHLFFWSNMRMRAPLIPVIALLAAYGFGGWFCKKRDVRFSERKLKVGD